MLINLDFADDLANSVEMSFFCQRYDWKREWLADLSAVLGLLMQASLLLLLLLRPRDIVVQSKEAF